MPTYVYRRPDGSTFEVTQKISEDPLSVDPATGQPVERVISGGHTTVLRGKGWHAKEYGRLGPKNSNK